MLHDFDEINRILAEMTSENMIEPIDEADCHPMDWAEVTGLLDDVQDEIYPEPMLDENGVMWYVS